MNWLEETHGARFELRMLILRKGRVVADDTIELEGEFTRVTEEAGTRNLSGRILQVMRS